MSINHRISQLISAFNDSESAFAKRIEVSSSVMFNIVNPKGRKSYPSGPVLEKILALQLDEKRVSAEWLMRGEGEMLMAANSFGSPEDALAFLADTLKELQDKASNS